MTSTKNLNANEVNFQGIGNAGHFFFIILTKNISAYPETWNNNLTTPIFYFQLTNYKINLGLWLHTCKLLLNHEQDNYFYNTDQVSSNFCLYKTGTLFPRRIISMTKRASGWYELKYKYVSLCNVLSNADLFIFISKFAIIFLGICKKGCYHNCNWQTILLLL